MLIQYLPILIFVGIAVAFGVFVVIASYLVGIVCPHFEFGHCSQNDNTCIYMEVSPMIPKPPLK